MSFNKLSLFFIWKISAKWLFYGFITAVVISFLCWLDGVASFRVCMKYSVLVIWSAELLIIVLVYLGLVMIKKKYTFYGNKFQVRPGALFQYIRHEMITFEEMKDMTPTEFKVKIEAEEKLRAKYPSRFERRLIKELDKAKKQTECNLC